MKNNYDVVIVGTGAGGCFTALHFPEDKNILMVTKSELEESDSFLAQGGICVLKDKDDFESFLEDTLEAGHYKNSEDAVKLMINSSRNIINELIDFGVDFTNKDGELLYTREGAHSKPRILYHKDVTGKEITEKLLKKVRERKNITILTKIMMVDIISENNICGGVVLKDEQGKIFPVYSEYTVLATGGLGGIYENSTNFPHLTGDALGIAIKNDIKLKDISYIQIHPTTLYSEKHERKFLISESVRGEGAFLYDKEYNRFANELIPRDKLTKKILEQMEKDGTNHVWLDMRPVIKKGIDIKKRFPNIVKKCLEEGYDVEKECIPVVPAQHYFMGGIEVDLNSRTSMKNLYAVGETSCNGVHGANRLASNSLLETLVFGKRAAEDVCSQKNESVLEKFEFNEKKYKDIDKLTEEYKEIILEEIEKDKIQKEKNL
ncbi:L-aspartate oxidase [Fusobacterium ulcerans]|uniref:L-aspartate oxidase n=1 Tax=Fusobacterium ulcerans TaxID=861 RepID=UPI001D0B2778|nr:L-aspartate oxidase [Fusobacterium ulcerans]MCB8564337.1 L-aspartate oxidase [Fusobacterium ulcerans]MCB8648075.1 L-aspartate oxidase [Fusobacterium ulcerans]